MRILRTLFNVAQAQAPKVEKSSLDRFMYKANGWCKYGLLEDDLMNQYDDDVLEALKRLPEHLVNERIFRQNRAAHLSMTHTYLPEDQWTKIEEDLPYLLPYVKEVEAERAEKKNWEQNNPL